ncbi:MAG: type 1 glutamine amidotransferase [Candidatus Obscuribacterales bacterium]|nr:type 1 glutamine amidotransferase [Candidatus Obscuribacterales bacterium]
MELKGKKVLIIAGPDFEDRELFYPQLRLIEAGANVRVAGIGERVYKGKYGLPVEVNGQCEELAFKETFECVIIPGGWAPDKIRANHAALEIVRHTVKAGGVVASICHGPWVLASADVVRGKRVTSHKNIKDDLVNAGAIWVDEEVVVDGSLVTSRTPSDLPAFCRELIKAMARSAVHS